MNQIKMTTPGEWIVSTNQHDEIVVNALNENGSIIKTIAVFGHIEVDGEDESTANAALLAVSKDMLDLIINLHIAMHEVELDAKFLLEEANKEIQCILSKLANEAGEEL